MRHQPIFAGPTHTRSPVQAPPTLVHIGLARRPLEARPTAAVARSDTLAAVGAPRGAHGWG